MTILAISGDSEKSDDSCEYGDLRQYGDAGESFDSIKKKISGDFGDFWLINYVISVNLGSFYLILWFLSFWLFLGIYWF